MGTETKTGKQLKETTNQPEFIVVALGGNEGVSDDQGNVHYMIGVAGKDGKVRFGSMKPLGKDDVKNPPTDP